MSHLLWLVSLVGLLCTAVVFGTDMFFLTVGRPALRLASASAGTEVMGFFHVFGDARMPVWGVLAILSNLLLGLLTRGVHRGLCLLSFAVLVLFVVIYNLLSKPINRLQTEAAKTGRTIEDARGIQASWDRSVMIRVPLLSVSILSQTIALSGYLAGM
jgi:hypothetical protein